MRQPGHFVSAIVLSLGMVGCAGPAADHHTTAGGVLRAQSVNDISICVVDHDSLLMVQAAILPGTNDTVVGGRKFSDLYPAVSPPYATGSDWYPRNASILFRGSRYHGVDHPPQAIRSELLQHVGDHEKVPIFVEVGDTLPEILYLPVRPGCIFQSYIGIHSGPQGSAG
jgi:hypothetical protein